MASGTFVRARNRHIRLKSCFSLLIVMVTCYGFLWCIRKTFRKTPRSSTIDDVTNITKQETSNNKQSQQINRSYIFSTSPPAANISNQESCTNNVGTHRERIIRQQRVCHIRNTFYTINRPWRNNTFLIEDSKKFFLCFIPKAGSTFFRSIFRSKTQKGLWDYSDKERASIIKDYLKVITVRHPYDRIWSAFIDKFTRPDTQYAKRARNIITKYRKHADSISLQCGHNVTFEEFLRYFIDGVETGEITDHHFLPYYHLCHICDIKYDVIVKLESITSDMAYLSSRVPVIPMSNYTLKSKWVLLAACQFRVREHGNNACLTPEVTLQRNWRAWKSVGIIDPGSPMPSSLPSELLKNLHSWHHWRKFCKSVIEEEQASIGDQETYLKVIKSRRDSFKREAFQTLSLETKEKLQRILGLDMELFGYEKF